MPIEERIKFWRDARNNRAEQHFLLPPVPPSDRLVFEPLSYQNAKLLYDIFHNDSNVFVDERFKSENDVGDYVACMMEYARYSGKRAAFDWFLKLKSTGEFIGVFHIHDLSIEKFGSSDRKATVGYAIGEKFRRQGFAREVVVHFSDFLFTYSNKIKLLVYTDKDNIDSIRLMESLNWKRNDDKYVYADLYAYFELWKNGYQSFVQREVGE